MLRYATRAAASPLAAVLGGAGRRWRSGGGNARSSDTTNSESPRVKTGEVVAAPPAKGIVGIVGGGIAGLVAGLRLAQAGVPSAIMDLAAHSRYGQEYTGLGTVLNHGTVERLQALGVPDLHLQGVPLTKLHVYYGESRLGTLDFDAVTAARGGKGFAMAIASRSLHELLWLMVQAKPTNLISIRHSMSVETIDRIPPTGAFDERLHLRLSGGGPSAGSGRSVIFGALIGADGVGSSVRSLAFGDPAFKFKSIYSGWGYWHTIADLPPDAGLPFGEALQIVMPGKMLRVLPVAPGKVFVMGTVTRSQPTPPPLSHDTRREQFLAHYEDTPHPTARAILSLIKETKSQFVQQRYPAHIALGAYATGPIALVGSAAHSTLPAFGQGTSLAIESALSAAGALAGAMQPGAGGSAAAALAGWNAAKHQHLRAYQAFCLNTTNQVQSMENMGWIQRGIIRTMLRTMLTDSKLKETYTAALAIADK